MNVPYEFTQIEVGKHCRRANPILGFFFFLTAQVAERVWTMSL